MESKAIVSGFVEAFAWSLEFCLLFTETGEVSLTRRGWAACGWARAVKLQG